MKNLIKKSTQAGFTLIELIVAIVILGILAAVAIPKYAALEDEANQSMLEGLASKVEAGSVLNYAAKKAGVASATAIEAGTTKCEVATTTALLDRPLPTSIGGYSVKISNSDAASGEGQVSPSVSNNTTTCYILLDKGDGSTYLNAPFRLQVTNT